MMELLGGLVLLVPFLLWFGMMSNKPGERATYDFDCQYCWFKIRRGQQIIYGNKGWGHVECVELARPRRRSRW